MAATHPLWLHVAREACLITGPIMLVSAAAFALHTAVFLRRSHATIGTVTALTQRGGDPDGNVAPVFTFLGEDGQRHTLAAAVASTPPEFRVGESVPVLYPPGNPAAARLATTRQLWFIPLVCAGLGTLALTVGLLLRHLFR